VSCGVDAYFWVGGDEPGDRLEADCVADGEELFYIVNIGRGSLDCLYQEATLTVQLPDGRNYVLDTDANIPDADSYVYYNLRTRIPGFQPYIFNCDDPPCTADVIGVSIRSDGSPQGGIGAFGNETLTCAEPCIKVTKTADPNFSKPGDIVTYTICVTNCSTGDPGCIPTLYNVEVVDDLLSPIYGSPLPGFPTELAPDQTVCRDFDYVVQEGDPDPLDNCATAVGYAFEPPPGPRAYFVDDVNCATVDLVFPDFTVEKICPEISKPGDEACYTVIITNTGETDLEIVDVNDSLCPLLNCIGVVLPPGGQCIDECCYLVPPGAPDPLVNTVTVTVEVPVLGNRYTKSDSCETDLVDPNFTVEKICPPISKPGDDACYEVIITNTGDTDLEIVDVNDSLCPLTDCIGVVLPPGGQCIDECCYLVQPGDPDPLVNTVTVTVVVPDLGNRYTKSDSCETDLVDPNIDLTKTVDNPEPCPGDTVTYTICIENTGDAPLENVVVTDPFLGGILPGFPALLFEGESWCEDFPYVVPEDANCPPPLENCAEVTSNPLGLPNVIDANDCAEICPEPCDGGQGCTPGFWKNNGDKHGASAWCDLYSPSMRISDVFILNEPLVIRGKGKSTITDPTLLQALGANGGGVNAMVRHGVAAMLNACSECVKYPINNPWQVIFMIEDTLNGAPGAYTVDELHAIFGANNEAGCPVNQHGACVGVED
jgi:uncharacterized repeat protein (TIGR01451 family)